MCPFSVCFNKGFPKVGVGPGSTKIIPFLTLPFYHQILKCQNIVKSVVDSLSGASWRGEMVGVEEAAQAN